MLATAGRADQRFDNGLNGGFAQLIVLSGQVSSLLG